MNPLSVKKIMAILIPLVKVDEMRKGCKREKVGSGGMGLSSRSQRQSGGLKKAVSYILLESLRKHVWGTLGNRAIPRWVTTDVSVSPVICNARLAG